MLASSSRMSPLSQVALAHCSSAKAHGTGTKACAGMPVPVECLWPLEKIRYLQVTLKGGGGNGEEGRERWISPGGGPLEWKQRLQPYPILFLDLISQYKAAQICTSYFAGASPSSYKVGAGAYTSRFLSHTGCCGGYFSATASLCGM